MSVGYIRVLLVEVFKKEGTWFQGLEKKKAVINVHRWSRGLNEEGQF